MDRRISLFETNIKIPGKLYIAGEYAVVEPGYSAIITTVDLFIHLKLKETTQEFGSIYSENFTPKPVKWFREKNQITLNEKSPALKYILSALRTTEDYVRTLGISLKTYTIEIESELEHQANKKLGLGSSGAVTVAVVKALNELYQLNLSKQVIYKLSVLAQLKLGVNSSFGDLAASTYTGWIKYTSFDRDFIKEKIAHESIKTLIEREWPYLEIEQLDVPKEVNFLVGWTKSPAISDDLVGSVQTKKYQNQKQYQLFLNESRASVLMLSKALEQAENKTIKEAIHKNRQALLSMGQETNVLIETPALKKLIDIATQYGGAAKTSGAGGGDSGIAFIFDQSTVDKIKTEWKKIGIVPLPLSIYKN